MANRSYLIFPALALPLLWLSAVNSASAQDTLYIGGSGQTGMEIDLGALDQISGPLSASKSLRHPGLDGGGFAPITLRPPGNSPSTISARATPLAPESKPDKITTNAETLTTDAPARKAVVTQKLVAPEPTPEPVPAKAAQEMTPENMVNKERAAASKHKKGSEPSASFPDETALLDLDPAKEVMSSLVPSLPGETMKIEFGEGESVLPQTAQAPLSGLAALLGQDETLRLQLKAYASGSGDSASQARRLSLSRALAVRSELIEQGVRSTRIDVRALGNKSENGTSDRVDIILVQH